MEIEVKEVGSLQIAQPASTASDEVYKPPTFSQIMEEKQASLLAEAKTLCDEGKPELAVRRLTRAIALNPTDPELFRLRGEAGVLARDYYTAIINLKKVLAMREDKRADLCKRLSVVYYQYGMELFTEYKHKEAAEMFNNSTRYDPKNKDAVTKRMECLIALQRYSECMEVIQREVSEDDSNPDLFVVRAQMNMLFGQTSSGYRDVCKALELNPHHAEALEMKEDLERKAKQCKDQAVHKSLLGKQRDALRKINDAIEIDPGKAEFLNLRGSLYRRLGDFNAAVDDFLLAMGMCEHKEDSPVYKNASKQLILTYNDFAMECFKQRQFDSAVTLLNRAIKQEKNEKGLYLNRGDCFYRLGNLQFALSDYQQALELDPSDWEVYCRVGVVCCEIGVELFAKGNYIEAEQLFSAAIQHNPKVSWFYTCRARAKYELKDISGSKEDILFSIVLDPKSDECLSLLARIYMGKSKEDLLCSHEAIWAQIKLKAIFKHIALKYMRASHKHKTGQVGKWTHKLPERILDGVVLKVAGDESDERPREKEAWLPPLGSPTKSKSIEKRRSWEQRPSISLALPWKEEEEEEGGKEGGGNRKELRPELKPREWSVLSHPLPEVSSDQHGVLAMLGKSIKEERFHKSIYYTKKECDLELEKLLASPPESYMKPPPPRLHDIHDIVIGGRNIVSSNTLIKSLKR